MCFRFFNRNKKSYENFQKIIKIYKFIKNIEFFDTYLVFKIF